MKRCIGIDEAGFGPTLGPLVVCAVAVDEFDHAEASRLLLDAELGIADSKLVHRGQDLAPLETVALAAIGWSTGWRPETAAECFALFGEGEAERQVPWMAGAADLHLPCAADAVPEWGFPRPTPGGLRGAIIHPRALNEAREAGINRSECLLGHVRSLLGRHVKEAESDCLVDRLGGRRYYSDALSLAAPGYAIAIMEETERRSAYRLSDAGRVHDIAFCVNGEALSALVALAGCISKYVRELHMRLFNGYWSGRHAWLKPTAGYAADSKRWLHQIGSGVRSAWETDLVRAGA